LLMIKTAHKTSVSISVLDFKRSSYFFRSLLVLLGHKKSGESMTSK
jgi:hypothetical protein